MKRRTVWLGTALTAAPLVLVLGTASALVLGPKSPEGKHRADIGKQLANYTLCLVKVAQKCEKGGAHSGVECHLDTGVVDNATVVDPKGKFGPAIQKCKDKVQLSKKGTGDDAGDYTDIGCPGDADPPPGGAPGDQIFSGIATYQAGALLSSPTQISALAILIDVLGCQPHTPASTDPAAMACVTADALALGKYAKGIFKCEQKCESDVKGTKGGGGDDDGPACNILSGNADGAFTACAGAALSAAGSMSPGTTAGVLPAVKLALDNADNDLSNQDDCP